LLTVCEFDDQTELSYIISESIKVKLLVLTIFRIMMFVVEVGTTIVLFKHSPHICELYQIANILSNDYILLK